LCFEVRFGKGMSSFPMGNFLGRTVSSSPEKCFIFELKMVRFGAFLVLFFYSLAACFTRKITTELMVLGFAICCLFGLLMKPPPVICIKLFIFS